MSGRGDWGGGIVFGRRRWDRAAVVVGWCAKGEGEGGPAEEGVTCEEEASSPSDLIEAGTLVSTWPSWSKSGWESWASTKTCKPGVSGLFSASASLASSAPSLPDELPAPMFDPRSCCGVGVTMRRGSSFARALRELEIGLLGFTPLLCCWSSFVGVGYAPGRVRLLIVFARRMGGRRR